MVLQNIIYKSEQKYDVITDLNTGYLNLTKLRF